MKWYEWFFDGIGSQLIGILIGFVLGGGSGFFCGYKVAKNRIKQKQRAGNYSIQSQTGNFTYNSEDYGSEK